MIRTTLATVALAGISAFALSTAALAMPAVGLGGDKTLVMFDTETLEVTGMMEIEGVDRLYGFDVRPADGVLYGIDSEFNIVSIDLETGAATQVATLSETFADQPAVVDFNPVADRLRFMAADGTNFRINPDDGAVTVDGSLNFDPADENADATPMVVGTAYTNSVGTPEATAMYDIDAGLVALLQQTAPNDGTLVTIGELGIEPPSSVAFDIYAAAEGENTAFVVTGMTLHTLDLETGAPTTLGDIAGLEFDLRDIAILPAAM